MNYLWDKSGSDPEIEKLEAALRVFRYKEMSAPALPTNVIPFKKKDSHRGFSIPMTIAAAVALVAVILGLWFFVSGNKSNVGNSVASEIKQEEEIPWAMLPTQTPKPIKKKPVPIPVGRKVAVAKNQTPKEEIKLTDEERYAYEQLMKALKITSDKLNYVKQKTQGEEEEKSDSGSD
jgi:hypothetical protein